MIFHIYFYSSSSPMCFIMKKIILLFCLIICLFCLTACYKDGGTVYRHLQEQSPSRMHSASQGENQQNTSHTKNESEKFCLANPHCCGRFTGEERYYHDMERRAIVEHTRALCNELPKESLLVNCPNQETYAYYSRNRCLAHFENGN